MITIIAILILTAVIGALPFGLVNLSVLKTAYQNNMQTALKVAHGASWIEVLYGMLALLAGSFIAKAIESNTMVKYTTVLIPFAVGIYFIFKKNASQTDLQYAKKSYLEGMVLNLLSVQVLLYWIVAITWLKANFPPEITPHFFIAFIASVWIGKMGVLWFYAKFSRKIQSRFQFLAKNINLIIGAILILTGFIQFFN